MGRLVLVPPGWEHEQQVMAYRWAFLEAGSDFDGCAGLKETETYGEWLDFDGRALRKHGKDAVPSLVFLAMREGTLVGILEIRTRLTDFLLRFGGNIGYSVCRRSGGRAMPRRCWPWRWRSAASWGWKRCWSTATRKTSPRLRRFRQTAGCWKMRWKTPWGSQRAASSSGIGLHFKGGTCHETDDCVGYSRIGVLL